MSHSQFHCITFILRHAWLSLWDKHMTTGRINQITIFKQCHSAAEAKRGQSKVVRLAKDCKFLAATTGSVSTCVAEGLVLSWLATNWSPAPKAHMSKLKCSSRDEFLSANLLPPGLSSRVEAGFAHDWLSDTIHTQSYNNLRFPQWGSHIQLLRLSRISRLS